jgi:hypothetical protein
LKKFFSDKSVACDLDTNEKLKHLLQEGDLFISADQHSSFYHYKYGPGHQTYVGASMHCSELPVGIGQFLAKRHPQAVLTEWSSRDGVPPTDRNERIRIAVQKGSFRFVFVYAGMMMGVSPSVAMLTRVMEALVSGWKLCTVGEGESLETCRGGNYVDDSIFAVSGRHYGNACELSLRIALEYVILGFKLNLKVGKTCLLPLPFQIFLGLLLDVRRGCWFSLSERRVMKVMAALTELRALATVGRKVPVLAIARVVGTIWSIHAVAHRAVSIMCRKMIRLLAVHLGRPELVNERDMGKLKRLLKVAWKGSTRWDVGGESELVFWLDVRYTALRSRMRHDAVRGDIKAWVARPDGTVSSDIRVFAVDSSATGSGGGEFIRDGQLWRMVAGTGMFVRLRDDEVGVSSCMRECQGIDRLDLAVIPPQVSRAVCVCDAQASLAVMQRGSGIPALQAVAERVFRRQLRYGRILFYAWSSRDAAIIECCDDRSRLQDAHAFQAAPAGFWPANDWALEI